MKGLPLSFAEILEPTLGFHVTKAVGDVRDH